jgi:hypothetical protein
MIPFTIGALAGVNSSTGFVDDPELIIHICNEYTN